MVVEERGGDQRERNLEVGTSWFQRQEDWAAIPANDGPESWQRIPVEIDLDARVGEPGERSRNVDYVVPSETIDVVELDPVVISNVDMQQQSISFEVDQVGVPVLVRVSYFPTWEVSGAEGPYRVAPNFMVVIPTENQVELTYSKTTLDWFFYSLTAFGIGLCFYWRRRGDLVYPSEQPRWGAASSADTTIASPVPASATSEPTPSAERQHAGEVPNATPTEEPDQLENEPATPPPPPDVNR